MIRLTSVAALSAAALALTSCGSATPGAAAKIGDETISMSTVNQLSRDMCTAFTPQLKAKGQTVPLSYLTSGVVQLLALEAQAKQVAQEYDVAPGLEYQAEVAKNSAAAAGFSPQVRASYVRILSASAFATSVADAAGAAALKQSGTAADPAAATAKGDEIMKAWPETHTYKVDPRFGMSLKDGALQPADQGLSFPGSARAQAAAASQQDQSYVDSLPASQKCGG